MNQFLACLLIKVNSHFYMLAFLITCGYRDWVNSKSGQPRLHKSESRGITGPSQLAETLVYFIYKNFDVAINVSIDKKGYTSSLNGKDLEFGNAYYFQNKNVLVGSEPKELARDGEYLAFIFLELDNEKMICDRMFIYTTKNNKSIEYSRTIDVKSGEKVCIVASGINTNKCYAEIFGCNEDLFINTTYEEKSYSEKIISASDITENYTILAYDLERNPYYKLDDYKSAFIQINTLPRDKNPKSGFSFRLFLNEIFKSNVPADIKLHDLTEIYKTKYTMPITALQIAIIILCIIVVLILFMIYYCCFKCKSNKVLLEDKEERRIRKQNFSDSSDVSELAPRSTSNVVVSKEFKKNLMPKDEISFGYLTFNFDKRNGLVEV